MNKIIKLLKFERTYQNRAILQLNFDVESVIHVGSGATSIYGAYVPLIKLETLENKVLFIIPESSWRGVLRKISENIAKVSINESESKIENVEAIFMKAHYEPETGPISHLHDKSAREELIDLLKGLQQYSNLKDLLRIFFKVELIETYKRNLEKLVEDEEARKQAENIASLLCPICRLWGGVSFRSKVIIKDSIIEEGSAEQYFRTHVAINRTTLVREEGYLYTVEYLYIKNKKIGLRMIIHNVLPQSYEAYIISGLLEFIRDVGLSVGGMKSRGIGHLKLNQNDSHVLLIKDFTKLRGEDLVKALSNSEQVATKMTINEYIDYLRGK